MKPLAVVLAVLLVAVVVGYVASAEPASTFTLTEAAWIEGLCVASGGSSSVFEYDPATRTVSVRITRPSTETTAQIAEFRASSQRFTEARGNRLVAFLNKHLASPVRLSMSKY